MQNDEVKLPVTVKPLEWRNITLNELLPHWHADHPHGWYSVIRGCDPDWPWDVKALGRSFKTVEDAKASAQADYAQRILSALYPPPGTPAPGSGETAAARDVLAERRRQVEAEGWTPEHDDIHIRGEMALAAAAYATPVLHAFRESNGWGPSIAMRLWPWDKAWWKPTTPRRDLVKAGALILAEIERLDRAIPSTGSGETAPAAPTGKWHDIEYLMAIIDAAIEDGFDPDEDGPVLDEIRAEVEAGLHRLPSPANPVETQAVEVGE